MAFKYSNANVDTSPAFIKVAKPSGAILKGGMLDWSTGASGSNGLTAATSSSTVLTIGAVAEQAAASGDAEVLALLINPNMLFIADATNSSSDDHNGQRMILTDSVTVNNTGTDVTTFAGKAVVRQIKPIGVAADKKILVQILTPSTLTA